MTPQPPRNVIVNVHIAGLAVSIGLVRVGGMWRDMPMVAPRSSWRVRRLVPTAWKAIAPPPREEA